MILPLDSALVRHIQSAVSSSGLLSTRNMRILKWVQRQATNVIKGLEHLSYNNRVRKLGLFGVEK